MRISENRIAASKLNRRIGCRDHFRRELRRQAEVKEGTRSTPRLFIFRQVASCLAHDPKRRWIDSLAGENV